MTDYTIVFDLGSHWVSREADNKTHKVWTTGLTHSTLSGTYATKDFVYNGNRAVDRCIDLASEKKWLERYPIRCHYYKRKERD